MPISKAIYERSDLVRDHHSLRVAAVPGKGRGVIACCGLPSGQLLEVAPAIPVEATVARPYLFTTEGRDVPAHADTTAYFLVFGTMSLVNHSNDPNARVEFRDSESAGMFAMLQSIEFITAGEEVTICYPDRDSYAFIA
jgi:hypothetical protein